MLQRRGRVVKTCHGMSESTQEFLFAAVVANCFMLSQVFTTAMPLPPMMAALLRNRVLQAFGSMGPCTCSIAITRYAEQLLVDRARH